MPNQMMTVPDWGTMKAIVAQKALRFNYVEYSTYFDVRAVDAERFQIILPKGTPEAADFEQNYKAEANLRCDARTVLVTATGDLAIDAFGQPFPVGGTAVAVQDSDGLTAPLETLGGALKVQDVGGGTCVRIAIGGMSPSGPGTVALAGVAVPKGLVEIKIEATLATTDGVTPTRGDLSVWVQTSIDDSDYSDWCPLALGVNSNTPAYSVRYADAPPPVSIEGVVPIGKNMAPSALVPCGGTPDNFVRTIFVAGAGTNHGVSQTIWLIGRLKSI
jgi:hypothetical protein